MGHECIIFNIMNMSKGVFEKQASEILSVLGNPFRVRIALALGDGEACVCHLEQMLNKRQAYISQHLMVLREAGLLNTRRDGKYIYYQLASKDILALIRSAAKLAGMDPADFPREQEHTHLPKCDCPHCGENQTINNDVKKARETSRA